MAFTTQQKGVIRGVLIASSIVIVVSLITVLLSSPHEDTGASKRMLLWLKWNLPKAACLAGHIIQIGNHRFVTPDDIGGAGLTPGTPQVKLMQAILQNTLEQVVLAALVHGCFAALAPARLLALLPAYSLLFVAGRVMFDSGYAGGAPARALGFALTFMPTLLMAVLSSFWLLSDPW